MTNQTYHSPIFIVGAARSGTTLLQYMLRSHPDISLPTAESHFFIPFFISHKGNDNVVRSIFILIALTCPCPLNSSPLVHHLSTNGIRLVEAA